MVTKIWSKWNISYIEANEILVLLKQMKTTYEIFDSFQTDANA